MELRILETNQLPWSGISNIYLGQEQSFQVIASGNVKVMMDSSSTALMSHGGKSPSTYIHI